MNASTYFRLSFLSGCMWAAIGFVLGREAFGNLIWAGVAVSPFIGLVAGLCYWGSCVRPLSVRLLLSLGTLYLAASLFGSAVGISDAIFRQGMPWAVGGFIVQAINATLWGLTFTGFFLVLWPLAFINHSLVCRWGRGGN